MKLAEIIEKYIPGDWGNEVPGNENPYQVSCIRGADIVPIENVDYSEIPYRYISERSYNTRLLSVGDIIIEKSGGSPTQSTGRVSIVTEDLLKERQNIVCSNFCEAFRVKSSWNPWYVYYYFRFIYDQGVFFNFEGKTSGLKNLQMDNAFSSIEIEEFDRSIQDKVANAILNLDNKIAINHQINKKLEAMAKQLYDYWFVQFDFPDTNGRPYKTSGGKMVWNETLKREIPEGWEDKSLSELSDNEMCSIMPSSEPDKVFKHFSIPAYDACGFYEEELGKNILSNKNVVTEHDVLVSKLNPWTSRVIWGIDDPDAICSTEYVSLRPKSSDEKAYMFMIAKSLPFMKYCTEASTGTSHSHRRVNPDILRMYKVPYSRNCVKAFCDMTEEFFNRITINKTAEKELREQRDFILPLLMTGQVSIG